MRIRRTMAILLALCLTAPLTGCQLAREEQAASRDRLVGALVTLRSLDLFDAEGFLNDHPGSLSQGGTVELAGAPSKYDGRLYAEEADGEYRFEGVEGALMLLSVETAADGSSVLDTQVDDWLTDVHPSVRYADEGRCEQSLEATLCLSPAGSGAYVRLNPVYRAGDGRVYVMEGQCGRFDFTDRGETGALSIAEEWTATENGETKAEKIRIQLNIRMGTPSERITVCQMDADDRELTRSEYAAAVLPEKIAPEAEAAWLLVEHRAADGTVRRTIREPGDTGLQVFTDGGDVCIARSIELNWPGAER